MQGNSQHTGAQVTRLNSLYPLEDEKLINLSMLTFRPRPLQTDSLLI